MVGPRKHSEGPAHPVGQECFLQLYDLTPETEELILFCFTYKFVGDIKFFLETLTFQFISCIYEISHVALQTTAC